MLKTMNTNGAALIRTPTARVWTFGPALTGIDTLVLVGFLQSIHFKYLVEINLYYCGNCVLSQRLLFFVHTVLLLPGLDCGQLQTNYTRERQPANFNFYAIAVITDKLIQDDETTRL